ncbi:MAG: hypothetical protein JWN70_1934 [Planctomycetaceae bacterium]|nr:hypothetical protein [Planctomycetaceae bacterium]
MLIDWLLLRIPDWKMLTAPQRRLVWEQCVRPLMVRRRVTDSYGILILATGGIGLWTGAFGEPIAAAALTFGYSLLTVGVDAVFVARSRDEIVAFIQEHVADIQAIA